MLECSPDLSLMHLERDDYVINASGHSGEAIPVPIPNTEVKLSCADDTADQVEK